MTLGESEQWEDAYPDGYDSEWEADGIERRTVTSAVRSVPPWALVVLAALLVAGSLGVFLIWRTGQRHSPEYSLERLESAIRAGDPVGVATYLDAEGVADDVYEAAADQAAADIVGDEYSWLAEGLADLAKPAAVDRLADAVTESILTESTGQRFAGALAAGSAERQETIAILSVPLEDGSTARFVMQFDDDHWRITGLRNAAEVYHQLSELLGLPVLAVE